MSLDPLCLGGHCHTKGTSLLLASTGIPYAMNK